MKLLYGIDMFAGEIICEDGFFYNSCSEEIGPIWYLLILFLITFLIIAVPKFLKNKKENRKSQRFLFIVIIIITTILVVNIGALVYIKNSVNNSNADSLQMYKDCLEYNKSSQTGHILPCEDMIK